MGIFSRLTDIVNSNLNAILDKAEDPEKIIRLVIQEMEETLVEVRSSAARTIADQKDIGRKLKRLDEIQKDWARKAELAINKGREDLAKAALVEKSKAAETATALAEEKDHLSEALARHEDDIVKLEQKLREARAKKSSIDARYKTASNSLRIKRNLHDRRIDDAFERFDKVESRLDRMEGEAESFDLGRGGRSLADEISDLEIEEEIENELKALKDKLAKSAAGAGKSAKAASKKSSK